MGAAQTESARASRTPEFRGRVYDSILDAIGATPLVKITRLAAENECRGELLAKLEYLNPLSSVKDRIGLAMIEAAETDGRIGPNTVIIEPTSGNTGIALAFVCAAKGRRLILTMPESASQERSRMLQLLGAEVVLTADREGMAGAIAQAERLVEELGDAFLPQQFRNAANPEIHRRTTGEEIWRDSQGLVDVLVLGVGTGGTLTGAGSLLKARKPSVRIVAVEPEDSPVLSGGPAGPHRIQGIGAGFIPDILDTELIDEVIPVANETALATARRAARLDGITCGISSGAALAAAIQVARRAEMADRCIVVVLPSAAERYLSTPLFDDL